MSKSSTIVSTATIRAAFVGENATLDPATVLDAKGNPVSTASLLGSDGSGTKVRGRVNPAFVAAYLAANPGTKFGEGSSAPAARTVQVPRKGASGRSLSPVTLPVSEAKTLAGIPGKRGRMSAAEREAAGQAYQAARTKAKA